MHPSSDPHGLLAGVAVLLAVALTGCDDGSGAADGSVGPEVGSDGVCASETTDPALTSWRPTGARVTGAGDEAGGVVPRRDAWHTMHGDTANSDHVWIALAPMLEFAWSVEEDFYVPEGPTFDNAGNLYFSPLFPREDVSLVSLNAETGARNWAISGDGSNSGSGAILILDEPSAPGEQRVYHMSYSEAMALRPDGTVIWRVPTGLVEPPEMPGVRPPTHSFGFNYHPQADAVIGVTLGGEVLAFDRTTGAVAAPTLRLPGAPAAITSSGLPPSVIAASNALTDEVFGTANGLSFFEIVIDVIFGGGAQVTNYFGIDPNTGRIFIAATADDAADGVEDGVSELGALYALDLTPDDAGAFTFSVVAEARFTGGTGSTPSISADGRRVYVSDNVGNVIAYDADLEELWRLAVGAPIVASIAVAPDGGELYAVTSADVFRVTDLGTSGRVDWTADLSLAFEGQPGIDARFNALTPTITANGVAVSVGGGTALLNRELLFRVGVGLLDRETGVLRTFVEGREESIAVTSVSPDGGIYTANSPVRHVSAQALFPDRTSPITGGISRYRPVRNDLLARDAACAAHGRAVASTGPSSLVDARHIDVLLAQVEGAVARAREDGDLSPARTDVLETELAASRTQLMEAGVSASVNALDGLCRRLTRACE
ncbi:MAG: PQQ-binding-like beta-propeller repeat protein [Myxococcota bacterium]